MGNLVQSGYIFAGWNTAANGSGTNYAAGSGTFTISANTTLYADWIPATPNIVLADKGTQVAGGNVTVGTSALVLLQAQLTVSTGNATLTGLNFTTAGTYAAGDITRFQAWYGTSGSLAGATQLGSDITTSLGAGTLSLPSLSQTINLGTVGYLFITADIAGSATPGDTVSVNPLTIGNFTFSSGNTSGSTSPGGTQTITGIPAPTVTSSAATGIGTTTATLNGN